MKYFFGLALPLYIVDQVTKYLSAKYITFGDSMTVIPGFFDVVHYTNTGAAFGMLQNQKYFFVVLAVVALIALVILKARGAFTTMAESIAWALLISGVAGNLTDRLFRGSVVDFLDFTLPIYGHWPAFNIADSCICVAAALLIWASFFGSKEVVKGQ
ncbi:MAG: signal peptidase II [Chthoniobacterales bacterium]